MLRVAAVAGVRRDGIPVSAMTGPRACAFLAACWWGVEGPGLDSEGRPCPSGPCPSGRAWGVKGPTGVPGTEPGSPARPS